MRTHLVKAMREAKTETSWTNVNEAYEEASLAFLDRILNRRRAGAFLRRLEAFVERIAPAGALNARTALALRVLGPGVPDFYQGSEHQALTVTDPDNRRAVDFDLLQRTLGEVSQERPSLVTPAGKLWLSRQLLRIRGANCEAFSGGAYEPVAVEGDLSRHVFAFRRMGGGKEFVVVTPRLTFSLTSPDGSIPPERWGDTAAVTGPGRWIELLTGREAKAAGDRVALADVLAELPLAVLQHA